MGDDAARGATERAHQMRGVIVFGVRDGVARWARFYLEPVDEDAGTVDDAVREQVVPRMILVAGGTGRLGTLVVSRLADARPRRARAHPRPDPGASPRRRARPRSSVGDVRDRASVEPAMVRASTTVVSAVQGFAGPGRGDARRPSIATATPISSTPPRRVGADVVLVSVVGARRTDPMELFRAKYDAEQHLRASGVPWTIVRATAFVELWAEIMAKPIVFGRGDNPINFVSVERRRRRRRARRRRRRAPRAGPRGRWPART